MDISINRLNNRMALQVPAELPLGLVFIVGRVARLRRLSGADGDETVYFDLVEGRHRLPCRLPGQVAQETMVREDDRVRAGGRLLFNARMAGYLLLARHLEVLPQRSSDTSLRPIVEDARERAQQTSLAEADLPPWVGRLAPPEVRRELGLQPPEDGDGVDEPVMETPARPPLSSDMVSFLSQAIDSDDDIELTAEMLDGYLPRRPGTNAGRQVETDASRSPEADTGHDQTLKDESPPPAVEREQDTTPELDELPFDLAHSDVQRPAPALQSRLALLAALLLVLLFLFAVLLILTQT